jgi:hypothetical protein
LVVAMAGGMSACANFTAPMECDGNPKCKADLQPTVPSAVTLTTGPSAAPRTAGLMAPRP